MTQITNHDVGGAGNIWSGSLASKPPGLQGSAAPALAVRDQLAIIQQSRQRSAAHGLNENDRPDFSPVGRADLSLLMEQNRALYAYALPVMDALFAQIANTRSVIVLTDADGFGLHTLGDGDFLEKAEKVAIRPGVTWSEKNKGTNAVGTAIAEGMPMTVHAAEHYLHANHFLTCSAAPIFDARGALLGVLDVTGDYRGFHPHTMALVRMSAQMIENQLFSAAFQKAITLHFHSRPELIGTLMEGIASFTPGGRFLSANRAGLLQLGLPFSALHTHTFSSLFGLPVSALFDHYRTAAPAFLELRLPSGAGLFARAELRLDNSIFQLASGMPRVDDEQAALPAHSVRRAPVAPIPHRPPGLRHLNTGDPHIASVIDKVSKVLGRDIPILLMGETGTGKDLFAQAIHHDSPHASGPFIAVNCASIPETLIESELFGYEDGAFTGARKNGGIGKILQASGGTLFLDEIGDMPLALQARLLRVLQERTVTPLGSTKSIPVQVALTCATNRNLRDMIVKGTFREDLYYRLNGLVIKLPPLRERSDLDTVIRKVLAAEAPGVRYTVAPDIMRLFRQHQWPGNFRQMANLLRTAMIMAGDAHEIRREHLSDDFLDDLVSSPPPGTEREAESLPVAGAKLDEMELSMIQKTLGEHDGNVSAAAKALGISRNTIYRKLHK